MIRDLSAGQWSGVAAGELAGPDGRTYRRRSTRSRRVDVETMIDAGAPLVLYWFGGGQLDWHDGEDVAAAWAVVRRDVTTGQVKPTRHGRPQWHAGRWEAEDGALLVLLTAQC